MALFGRHDEPEESPARVGALLLADGLDCLRVIRDFLLGLSKGSRRG
jgi:hypothetical protein